MSTDMLRKEEEWKKNTFNRIDHSQLYIEAIPSSFSILSGFSTAPRQKHSFVE